MLMLLADVVVGVETTLTDVDCQVADEIATVYSSWQMLLPSGRCYSYYRVVCLILFLLLEADGRAMGLLYMKLNLKKFR